MPEGEERRREPDEPVLRTLLPRPSFAFLRNVIATIAVGAIIVGLVWLFDRPGGGAGSEPEADLGSEPISLTASAGGPAPRVGSEAPDFRVQGLDGEYFQLSDFRGRPVWITFWASWCPPCRAETPDIQAVYEENREEGLVVIAINIGEDADKVRGYTERTNATFVVGLDQDDTVAAEYRVAGLPSHFFVDGDGILRESRAGSMSEETMAQKVEELISSSTDGDGA